MFIKCVLCAGHITEYFRQVNVSENYTNLKKDICTPACAELSL